MLFCQNCHTEEYTVNDKECVVCSQCGLVLSSIVFGSEFKPSPFVWDPVKLDECTELTFEIMEKLHIASDHQHIAKSFLKIGKTISGFEAEEWAVVVNYLVLETI